MPSTSPSSLDTDLAVALQEAVRMMVRRARRSHSEGELTSAEWGALTRLKRTGPATPGALARLELITPQGMGVTLAGLEARGLVERAPDPEDGRRTVMSLTRAGHEALARRRSIRTDRLTQALARELSAGERETLRNALPLLERLAEWF